MRWRTLGLLIWCVCCAGTLLWSTVYCESNPHPMLRAECAVLPGTAIVLMSVPSGLVWLAFIGGMSYLLHASGWDAGTEFPGQIGTLLVWLGFSLIGYVQWFKVLPDVIRRIKTRRQEGAHK